MSKEDSTVYNLKVYSLKVVSPDSRTKNFVKFRNLFPETDVTIVSNLFISPLDLSFHSRPIPVQVLLTITLSKGQR